MMMTALKAQCKAELLRTMRNRRFLLFSLLMPLIFYFIFTGTLGDHRMVDGVEWKAYYLMSMTIFGLIGSNVITLGVRFAQERTQGWTRLLRISPLPRWCYIASKMFAWSMINLGSILLMFIVCGLAKGIRLPAYEWIGCGLWIWIGPLPFMALGILIGMLKSAEVVQIVGNLVYMSMSVLGGLWMPLSTMPDLIQKTARFLPSYRFGQGAWSILGGHLLGVAGTVILAAYTLVFMVLSAYILKRQEAV
ncbi:ABC transporter permease [Paenibacillus caui]|uniref:ABC transporter permease n=1 Tax=Paenibacillus caui TaxID=2873927 RepID=UPI001CA94857|nr:ABC transporter permease [Paenibacillus caui]